MMEIHEGKQKLGWFFSASDARLRFGDGRKILPGITHRVPPSELCMCALGLHACDTIKGAIIYAPSALLWRVVVGGTILEEENVLGATEYGKKYCASNRTYLWKVNIQVAMNNAGVLYTSNLSEGEIERIVMEENRRNPPRPAYRISMWGRIKRYDDPTEEAWPW